MLLLQLRAVGTSKSVLGLIRNIYLSPSSSLPCLRTEGVARFHCYLKTFNIFLSSFACIDNNVETREEKEKLFETETSRENKVSLSPKGSEALKHSRNLHKSNGKVNKNIEFSSSTYLSYANFWKSLLNFNDFLLPTSHLRIKLENFKYTFFNKITFLFLHLLSVTRV